MQQDEPQLRADVPIDEVPLPPVKPEDSDALLTPPLEDQVPSAECSPFSNNDPDPMGDPYVTVFAGYLVGRLHLQLFQCPGIHEPCIEINGEMLTPKEFIFRAGKNRQKDWKGSIHVERKTLRFMMETKAIVFYNHEKQCSKKCHSRNRNSGKIRPDWVRSIPVPVYPKTPNYSLPPSRFGEYLMPPMHQPFYPVQAPTIYNSLPRASIMPTMGPAPFLYPQQFYNRSASEDMVHKGQLIHAWLERLHRPAYTSPDVAPGVANFPPLHTQQFCASSAAPSGVMPVEHLINIIETDPAVFWSEARRVGLLPDYLQMINNSINGLRLTASDPNFDIGNIAPTLTRVIEALDLKPFVVSCIQMRQGSYGAMPHGVNNAGASMSSFNFAIAEGSSTTSSEIDVVTVDFVTAEHLDPRDRLQPISPSYIRSDHNENHDEEY